MNKLKCCLSIISCICLVSCNNPQVNNESSLEILEGTYVQVANGNGETPYSIVYGDISEQALSYVNDFATKLNEKCNIDIEVLPQNDNENINEILVGYVSDRGESIILSSRITPTAYNVREADEKIVLSAFDDQAIKKGLDKLYESIVIYDGVNWGIKQNYDASGDGYMNTYVPKLYENVVGTVDASYYYCDDGNYEVGYNNSDIADYNAYCSLLEQEGFEVLFNNQIGENVFVTYTKEDALVNLAYYPNQKRCSMIYGPKNFVPYQMDNASKVIEPSITQIAREGASQSSPGLSIVVQLIDGSYVIIDGGPEDSDDEITLLEFLCNNNPNEGKPQVTWMFTHAHHDHMGLAVSFLEKYKDAIDVNLFCYNFPDFDSLPISQEPVNRIEKSKELINEFKTIYNNYYSDVPIYIFHTGDKLQLPGCEIEILITHETFYPNDFPWINHTSSAWTMKIKDTKMIILGDCEQTVCEWMSKTYEESLKCDILQVTHHGLNGGSIDFYSFVDPSICFWPIDNVRFNTEPMCLGTRSGFEYNAWLRNKSIRVREHYAATNTTTIKL